MISTIGNTIKLSYSEINAIRTGARTDSARTSTRTVDNDRLRGTEGEVDIIMLNKINKIPILSNYYQHIIVYQGL